MKISMLSDHVCHLGEGPLWDVQEQALYWVSNGRSFHVHEARCRAAGDDFCEIVIRKRPEA